MNDPSLSTPSPSEALVDLIKDGGRRVMYGGDPYEDDVERDLPSLPSAGKGGAASKDAAI
jgi:hypothetical protein